MTKRLLRFLAPIAAAALFAAALFPAAGWALGRETALGAEGEMYIVRAGLYSELFPGQSAYPGDNVVLALDVQRPDASAQRLLVRGTGTEFVESSPSLIVEQSSDTLFLVWESRPNHFNPILMLSWFQGGEWSNPIEIVSHEFADKTPPQIAITHDTYADEDGGASRRRTLVHLLWGEKDSRELRETYYTALVLENGVYAGKSPIYDLNELDTAEDAATAFETATNLVSAPRLAAGRDERTVVVAFASAVTRRVLTLEIDVLPVPLSQLADKARAYIIDVGARATAGDLHSLADKARAYIIDVGVAYRPEVRRSIAELVYAYLRNSGPLLEQGGIQSVAGGARAYIIDVGAKLSGRGLQNANADAAVPSIREVEYATLAPEAAAASRPSLLFQMSVASSRPAPRVGAGPVSMLVSENAENVLISWAEPGKVVYLESDGGGWTKRRELALSPSLDLARANEMLAARLRDR
jgi:hypothetical protein